MEERPRGDVASCDLDLHEVEKPIAARDRDASHTRREAKLHRSRRSRSDGSTRIIRRTQMRNRLKRPKEINIRSKRHKTLRADREGS